MPNLKMIPACRSQICQNHSKVGIPKQIHRLQDSNIVGSCDVRFPIRLEGLAYSHGHFSSYEPELFPGLIYRMVKPKIVLLIFVSGKIVLTGAKVREEIYQAFQAIYCASRVPKALNNTSRSLLSTLHYIIQSQKRSCI